MRTIMMKSLVRIRRFLNHPSGSSLRMFTYFLAFSLT